MESAVRAPQPARAVTAARPRGALLDDAGAARALDVAQRIFTASLPLLEADRSAPESIGRYGGAVLVAESLARAGRGDDAAVRALLREALVFAPDRLSLYDGAGGLLVVLDAVDPQRASLAGVRARLRAALDASLIAAPPGDPTDMLSFDLVSGVAGRAIALRGDASPQACDALRSFAVAFADLVESRLESGDENVAAVNLGVAHGVPGMLAALNAALP
ncbi:MAG TPA: lanthionine synthetase LanC family protein, partial [Candidatus Elarobacter sp.]|nr:lanthionine synthetase LanC family protein [Candidatus Elarobacter sp.]